jgi:hypothetical protein
MPKPDFIIVGFQKCGTTAIKHILNNHFNDQTYIPNCIHADCPNPSEIDFFTPFSKTSKKSIEWYESLFKENVINGDKSPSYTVNSKYSAQKIFEYKPDIKLIFTMRDPVKRAISAYNHYCQIYPISKKYGHWNIDKSFAWNFNNTSVFSLQGKYIEHIEHYLKLFDRKQMLFIIQERLKNKDIYQKQWNRICNFLGIKAKQITQEFHHSRKKTVDISQKDIELLKDYYQDYNKKLFEFLGTEIPGWTK